MSKLFQILVLLFAIVGINANATVCNPEGKLQGLVPSMGVAGFSMDTQLGECDCAHNVIWIDTATQGGQAMYSAALAAKMADRRVLATIEDGLGEGAEGNTSISYRYWATCKLIAFQIL
ncbi:hypothetical protein [Marinibactrum halimedae]|uniref:Uncharacterized protein n=1 Tax=Marinibactrum halimedae TaxID=1444977 RepID=A0AA37T6Y0_9GAMM|nr:hypothetical protein [Marinibactrum halimedae]MCD9457820.1 hypothetical protein [Marinibactrum halimedae]GLS24806.1 hypothetical protein GCM10007877_05200 [Marinibactrum halimedae]